MTTNKVKCGQGKCPFTDEFCASGDCPYDHDVLKKQKKINISEGNVKDDNIKSGKTKHGDFIVKYLEEGSHYKVKEINVMENVAQRNSQDSERVADTSKTIDHIADVNKKVSLTEQWKKGKLPKSNYWIKYISGKIDIWWLSEGVPIETRPEISEVLAEVPDYLMWKNYVNGYCEEHEYNLKLQEENERLKKWVEEFNALNVAKENQKLKELLKECDQQLYEYSDVCLQEGYEIEREEVLKLKTKIDEVLK